MSSAKNPDAAQNNMQKSLGETKWNPLFFAAFWAGLGSLIKRGWHCRFDAALSGERERRGKGGRGRNKRAKKKEFVLETNLNFRFCGCCTHLCKSDNFKVML